MKKLENKVSLITGASAGMGRAMAILFASEGSKVVASDINQSGLEKLKKEAEEKGLELTTLVADVSKEEDIKKMVDLAVSSYGSLDVLVNNAGIIDDFKTVGEASNDLWDRIIAVNLTGPFKISRAAVHVMEKQENGGVIINNSSIGGMFGVRGGAAYVTSKHGLNGLTRNMAATYGVYGNIRVNAIAPGGVETDIQGTIKDPSELGNKALEDKGEMPMGSSEDLARVALFLASDDSSFVNGAILTADGGWTTG